jgi:flavin reductase (DIM6/NTAB) family NADH-FMN oxidoreductase RutF
MLDESTFRAVLGRFATGVSVITTIGTDGRDHGMTATAFASLSLDPPLILACVAHTATIHPHIMEAQTFGVSFLGADQEPLSRRFAETNEDKFDGVGLTRELTGAALLDDALAHLECAVWARYDGGDHTIVVGRVDRAVAFGGRPLLYYRGGYTQLER